MKLKFPFISTLKSFFSSGGQSFSTWLQGGINSRTHFKLLLEYKNLVYTCINAIAEDVAQYEPILQRRNEQENKLIKIHPFTELLKNPNPGTSQYELFEATQSYIELVGESFWFLTLGELTGRPKEITVLRPDRMSVVIDDDSGRPAGYVFKRFDGIDIPIDLNEIIHIKTFNPINSFRGIGTVQAGLLYIDTEESTSLFQHNFLKNQATPSGVLTLKGNISKEAFQKLKKKWKESQGGLDNVGKTLFIRQMDASFEKLGLSLSDLNMEAIKRLSRDDVLQLFRVPEAILGKTDASGLGRANIETIEYIFAKRTIDPKLVRLDDTIHDAILKYYGDDLIVTHVSQIPSDKEAELNQVDKALDRWITRNEARRRQGLEPIQGGDELFLSFNQVPLNSGGQIENSFGKIKVIKKKTIKKDVTEEPQTTQNFFVQIERFETRTRNAYRRELNKLLKEQQRKVTKLITDIHSKQIVETLDGINFELIFLAEEIQLGLVAHLLRGMEDSGEVSLDFVGEPDQEFVLRQATRDAVFESTERLMLSFNEETALKIQKQLAAGLAENESVQQLAKRIESIYSEARGFRAKRIALTESHNAVNEGMVEAYKQTGVKQVRWVANANACQFCAAMDGTIIEIGSPFLPKGSTVVGVDGGEFIADFTDVRFANLHPNCNCYPAPV